jgi:hypothetical protein
VTVVIAESKDKREPIVMGTNDKRNLMTTMATTGATAMATMPTIAVETKAKSEVMGAVIWVITSAHQQQPKHQCGFEYFYREH